jgi:hypothetical protein
MIDQSEAACAGSQVGDPRAAARGGDCLALNHMRAAHVSEAEGTDHRWLRRSYLR